GLGGRFNMIMQSAFFKLANIIPLEDAIGYLKDSVVKSYGKKGQHIVDMNNAAIDKGVESAVQITIPASWKDAVDAEVETKAKPDFVKNIVEPMNRQEGDKLPVSAFIGMEDGTFQAGTAAYEKRGIAINVPEWQADNCIQCNQCSYVCPHATIRPVLLTEAEKAAAPEGYKAVAAKGLKAEEPLFYSMQISPLDCSGCGNCAQVCPAPSKALVMKPQASQLVEIENWDYSLEKVAPKANPMNKNTVKGSQFETPLLEFSGACAGCGETPYAKLITQLFGDRMMIANATGCSSIWGGSAPSTPYTVNHKGQGPAWANSLFEDNAEFGLGMFLGVKAQRERLAEIAQKAIEAGVSEEAKAALEDWTANLNNGEGTRARGERVVAALQGETNEFAQDILKNSDYLVKRSQWIFGGDGWAYDIGYGGVDHVLASGEDVNIFVFDTEVYSNTGGQSSKSTPTAAIAKFAASGKKTKKKDLGMMAMSYGYVYVAQINMGADKNQVLKAIAEAEAYKGPSLIIAYAPCINHGLKVGMGKSQEEARRATACGYWQMYRFNPALKEAGKNPFSLDSKEPTESFREFLMGEVRYSSLAKAFPEAAEALFEKTEKDAKERLENYKKLANQ
ncbi:MAG: pyruvate:ferredoxin (flavodoxin) oxidoreductase, partial [Clostridiaceae bacterium]